MPTSTPDTASRISRGRLWSFSIIFVVGALIMLTVMNFALKPSQDPPGGDGDWWSYKQRAENSIDMLVVGNSFARCTISPMQMWSDYGISTWSLSGSSLNPPSRKAWLIEGLKTQTPQVVVVELSHLFRPEIRDTASNRWAYENLPLSPSKVRSVLTTAEPKMWEFELLPLQQNHQRYAELTRDDVMSTIGNLTGADRTTRGGVRIHPKRRKLDNAYYVASEEDFRLASINLEHLRSIAEMSHEKGAKVVFFISPAMEGPRHIQMYEYARGELQDEYPDIVWLDMNGHMEEMGIDASDFRDNGHLAIWGMEKATKWMAETLLVDMVQPKPDLNPEADWWDDMANKWNRDVKKAKKKYQDK